MTSRTSYPILIFAFFLCFLSGCQKEEMSPDNFPVSVHRTILVYLGVGDNFRAEAAQKIGQLKNIK